MVLCPAVALPVVVKRRPLCESGEVASRKGVGKRLGVRTVRKESGTNETYPSTT